MAVPNRYGIIAQRETLFRDFGIKKERLVYTFFVFIQHDAEFMKLNTKTKL